MFTKETAAENRLMKQLAEPVAAAMTTEQLYNIQYLKRMCEKWIEAFDSLPNIKAYRLKHQFHAAVMRERGRRVNKETSDV